MNPALESTARRSVTRRLFWPAAILTLCALLVIGVTGYFRLSPDARSLRNSITHFAASQGISARKQVELHFGPFTLEAARLLLHFVPMQPEARTAMSAVQGTEFGIYKLDQRLDWSDGTALLSAADHAMAEHGWERIVGVANEREWVAVYLPKGASSATRLDACVAVMNARQLVIASARTRLEPLMQLVAPRLARGGDGSSPEFLAAQRARGRAVPAPGQFNNTL